jgi:hypothetical protein
VVISTVSQVISVVQFSSPTAQVLAEQPSRLLLVHTSLAPQSSAFTHSTGVKVHFPSSQVDAAGQSAFDLQLATTGTHPYVLVSSVVVVVQLPFLSHIPLPEELEDVF